jgi:hypothetical protein
MESKIYSSSQMELLKYSSYCSLVGAAFVPLIFIVYAVYPELPFLQFIANFASAHARTYSAQYYSVSVVASFWTETAPLVVLITFLTLGDRLKPFYPANSDPKKLWRGIPYLLVFVVMMNVLAYWGEMNLSHGLWSYLKIVSGNVFFLCFYYILVYLAYYFIEWLPLFYIALLLNAIRTSKKKEG